MDWRIYHYKQLVFGVRSVSKEFQEIMDKMLSSCGNIVIFIDDKLIYGKDEKELDAFLQDVLKICERHSVLLSTRI